MAGTIKIHQWNNQQFNSFKKSAIPKFLGGSKCGSVEGCFQVVFFGAPRCGSCGFLGGMKEYTFLGDLSLLGMWGWGIDEIIWGFIKNPVLSITSSGEIGF